MTTITIMAGGTGGHVIPALAVADELAKRGVEVSWIGTEQGLESTLVRRAGIDFDAIKVKGVRGSGLKRKLILPWMLLTSMLQSAKIFRLRKPKAVLGMGGFVSGPGGLVAVLLGIPLVLHEQNTVAGLTNSWLGKMSKRVFSGFPQAIGLNQFVWVGNPVRDEIANLATPKLRLADRSGPLRILVIGGSQGASIFNECIPVALGRHEPQLFTVRHQCGKGNEQAVVARYDEASVHGEVSEFIDDMAQAYAWSDVVIGRAGAMTVSEICAAGVAALFVPYPYAVNDHQRKNAQYLSEHGGACLVDQADFSSGDGWVETLIDFKNNRGRLIEMATCARTLAKTDATLKVSTYCLEVAGA